MSSWWGAGDDSGEESDLYSSEEEVGVRADAGRARTYTLDESSSEDEGRRVVRSKKTARFDAVRKHLDTIAAKLKINDWVAISEEWAQLDKALAKSRSVMEAEGVPRFVAAALVALEDAIAKAAADKSSKKTMKPQNFKSFTKMKQTYKKFNKADFPGLDAKIAHVRAHPDEESDDESADEGKTKGKAFKAPKKGVDAWFGSDSDDESDDDDSDSYSDDDDSDSDDDDEDVYILGEKRDISYWFTPDKERSSKKKEKREAREKKKLDRNKVATRADDEEDEGTEADDEGATKKRSAKEASTEGEKEEWTQEKVDKKLKELLGKRGTKAYDRSEAQRVLTLLLSKAEGAQNVLAIKFHLLNTHFDAAVHARNATLPLPAWRRAYNALVDILRSLHSLIGSVTLYESTEELNRALGEDAAEKPLPANATVGHLLWAVEHLCDAYWRLLITMEPHSARYVTLLSLERDLLLLIISAQHYYVRTGNKRAETALAARQLDLLYYKRAQDIDRAPGALLAAAGDMETEGDVGGGDEDDESKSALGQTTASTGASGEHDDDDDDTHETEGDTSLERPPHAAPVTGAELTARVESLARAVYRHSHEDRAKRRAMMEHVYHLALHDRFYEGRDMLLMSHLPDKISLAKPPEQVLYNRVLVQLGLCAFRLGRVKEAHACLAEIAASGRTKELLAQGMTMRYGPGAMTERSNEQEQEERARQMPHHMHIALDLIELAHMLSAMLLEVPNMALARHRVFGTQPRKVISKAFRRLLDNYERQVFTGPPENTREHILVAGRLLLLGEWRRARAELFALDAWRLVPDAPKVHALLEPQIRDVALRTYVLAALPHYKAIALPTLASMFEVSEGVAHATLSRMIGAQELSAAWDQRTGALVPHAHAHVEPSALQALALHFADRAGSLLDASESYDQKMQQQQGADDARTQRYGAHRGDARRAYANAPRSDRRVKGQQQQQRGDRDARSRR